MKKAIFLLAMVLLNSIQATFAQKADEKSVIESLAGTWQYVEEVTKADGRKAYIGRKIYKTITTDKKYQVMISVDIPLKEENSEETTVSTISFITQKGEIEITSDNTYLEYIHNHFMDKNLNNTISNLRFRFGENKNIIYIEYNIGGESDVNWISEVWVRVLPLGA